MISRVGKHPWFRTGSWSTAGEIPSEQEEIFWKSLCKLEKHITDTGPGGRERSLAGTRGQLLHGNHCNDHSQYCWWILCQEPSTRKIKFSEPVTRSDRSPRACREAADISYFDFKNQVILVSVLPSPQFSPIFCSAWGICPGELQG